MAEALKYANTAFRAFLYENPEVPDNSMTYLTWLSGFQACLNMEADK